MQGTLLSGGTVVAWTANAPDLTGDRYPVGPGLVDPTSIQSRPLAPSALATAEIPCAFNRVQPGADASWFTLRSWRFDPAQWPAGVRVELAVQGFVTGSGTAAFRVIRVSDSGVVTLSPAVTLSGSSFGTDRGTLTKPASAQDWLIQVSFDGPTAGDVLALQTATLALTL